MGSDKVNPKPDCQVLRQYKNLLYLKINKCNNYYHQFIKYLNIFRKSPAEWCPGSGLDLFFEMIFLSDQSINIAVIVNALGPIVRNKNVHR